MTDHKSAEGAVIGSEYALRETEGRFRELADNIRQFESRFRHRNGSYRWLSWKAVPDQGRIYAMARDVTELKAAEHKLEEAGGNSRR